MTFTLFSILYIVACQSKKSISNHCSVYAGENWFFMIFCPVIDQFTSSIINRFFGGIFIRAQLSNGIVNNPTNLVFKYLPTWKFLYCKNHQFKIIKRIKQTTKKFCQGNWKAVIRNLSKNIEEAVNTYLFSSNIFA